MVPRLPLSIAQERQPMAQITNTQHLAEHAGKYLIFLLGREEFGVSVLKIREIIPVQVIVKIPQAPPHIRGVINLRGTSIAVTDLRQQFGLEHIEETERTCIVVADVETNRGNRRMGMMVDGVAEVQNIAGSETTCAASTRGDGCASAKVGATILCIAT